MRFQHILKSMVTLQKKSQQHKGLGKVISQGNVTPLEEPCSWQKKLLNEIAEHQLLNYLDKTYGLPIRNTAHSVKFSRAGQALAVCRTDIYSLMHRSLLQQDGHSESLYTENSTAVKDCPQSLKHGYYSKQTLSTCNQGDKMFPSVWTSTPTMLGIKLLDLTLFQEDYTVVYFYM
ncbi:unnamed protein product [Dicrocoelium dendriticum]|nr:unnamed protein product [Dicrocoelium dendriticum]